MMNGLEFRLVRGLRLVVREFNLVFCRFFIVNVAGVAAAKIGKLVHKDVLATCWDVKYRSRYPRFALVQRERAVELYLIHGLVRWPERLVDLEIASGVSKNRDNLCSRSPVLSDPRIRGESQSRGHAPTLGACQTPLPLRSQHCS